MVKPLMSLGHLWLVGYEGANSNNNEISNSPADAAEILQNVFTKPWSNLPETIIPSLEEVEQSLRRENPPTLVKAALKQLNPKKATGSDMIPGWVLKRYCEELTPVLHDIICSSTIQSKYPFANKLA